ncbi:MAG TPA: M28 family peptidase [Ignavibacteriaceae bacterium]|jgi:glutaminyl-peptide cyclotransferase|nr:M28 family peptidase [Ignavibacteriaceae bacterium]
MKFKNLFLLLIVLIMIAGCEKKEEYEISKPAFDIQQNDSIPVFNGEDAYAFTKAQVDFGPRNPGSNGHTLALTYLQNELNKYADEMILQSFTYPGYNEDLNLTNIVARFNPGNKNRILICAHWDTRPRSEHSSDSTKRDLPIPGANDGASGCGVILELANILHKEKPGIGVDLVLLDGEDYGKESDLDNYCLGSKYFSVHIPDGLYPGFAILLDMVGDKEAVFMKEANSVEYAPDIVNLIWSTAVQLNASAFIPRTGGAIYDDHIPLNQAGIKTIDIIDADLVGADTPVERRNYWHSDKDTMENIGKNTLQQVGTVLTYILYSIHFNS